VVPVKAEVEVGAAATILVEVIWEVVALEKMKVAVRVETKAAALAAVEKWVVAVMRAVAQETITRTVAVRVETKEAVPAAVETRAEAVPGMVADLLWKGLTTIRTLSLFGMAPGTAMVVMIDHPGSF